MENFDKLIEDYLSGALSDKERADFELRLQSDPALANAFQLQKSMNAFLVKENNKDQLIPQLEALGKKHFEESDKTSTATPKEAKVIGINRRRLFTGLAIAASLAFILFAVSNFFQKPLYEQYAYHEPINLIEKSENNPKAVEAQNFFNKKEYQKAAQSLTEYLREAPTDTKAILARGICSLELNQLDQAIEIFTPIHNGQTALKAFGTWYLALTYLKKENTGLTKEYLELIPSSEGGLYKKAQDLLGALED